MKALELMGIRFGKLTALSKSQQRIRGSVAWICKCDCGNSTITTAHFLVSRHTKSCGCLVSESLISRTKTHGLTPIYTLERNNNNLGYSPENCVWATPLEQSRNKRKNKVISKNGKTMIQADWERHLD